MIERSFREIGFHFHEEDHIQIRYFFRSKFR